MVENIRTKLTSQLKKKKTLEHQKVIISDDNSET